MSITRYRNDLFASYSHRDDKSGWVRQFLKHLEEQVALLHGRPNELTLWRDSKPGGSDLFDEVVRHKVRTSALFLALLSPSYLRSEWARKELSEFFKPPKTYQPHSDTVGRSRALPILLYPLPSDSLPDELRDVVRINLFSKDRHELGAPLAPDDRRYHEAIQRLAEAILDLLFEIANEPPGPPPPQADRGTPAPDVFISYARENRSTAEALARRLSEEGWLVFWDREIPVGRTWEMILEAKLDAASSVVVLWSRASVASEWVVIEANEGLEQGKLLPVLIERVRAPLRFRRLQAAELVTWDRRSETRELQGLVQAVARLAN